MNLKARVRAITSAKKVLALKVKKAPNNAVRFRDDDQSNRSLLSRASINARRFSQGSIDHTILNTGDASSSRYVDTASPDRKRVIDSNLPGSYSAFEIRDQNSSVAKGSVNYESERPNSIVTYKVPEQKGLAEHQRFID